MQRFQIVRVVTRKHPNTGLLLERRVIMRSPELYANGDVAHARAERWNRLCEMPESDHYIVVVEGGSPFRPFDLYRPAVAA